MKHLVTTLGLKRADELGLILPHEHIFVDFRGGDDRGAEASAVVAAMKPEIAHAQAAGVTALVDATAIGGARRADILRAVSETTGLPIVVATGIFKEPWKTNWVRERGEDALADWMSAELDTEIEGTGVRAGWIKLSAADGGLTDAEITLVRAAARAGRQTDATIGSHTVRGVVARDQLDQIERTGYSANRFIWIHAQMELDFSWHVEIARRGGWIEYDALCDYPEDEQYIEWIRQMLDEGLGDHILLSHDCGGYDPTRPDGGTIKSYTYLIETFLPKLRAAGVDEAAIRQMTYENPFRAYAR